MSLEMWNTIATVGTFTVITATAIAALVQLRHLRRANQLAGLQSTFEMLQDPSVREIVNYVRHDLAVKMQDPSFREGLRAPAAVPVDRRDHPEYHLCDMYNHIGSFIRSDLIDESIYLQTEWVNVGLYWGLLRGAIEEGRKTKPYIFENFEWLAARAKRWADAHPHGDYPAGEPRMTASANDT